MIFCILSEVAARVDSEVEALPIIPVALNGVLKIDFLAIHVCALVGLDLILEGTLLHRLSQVRRLCTWDRLIVLYGLISDLLEPETDDVVLEFFIRDVLISDLPDPIGGEHFLLRDFQRCIILTVHHFKHIRLAGGCERAWRFEGVNDVDH